MTSLAEFVQQQMGLRRQSEICRDGQFDQGLFSKVASGQINTLTLESILRLSLALECPAQEILARCENADRLTALLGRALTEGRFDPMEFV